MLAKPITRRGENQHSPHDFLSDQPRSAHPVHRNAVGWRLEAVRQVRLLMGQGYRRFAAQHEIATQLGRTIDEMQEWERSLLRSPDYENDLLCSELAGEFLERLVGGHYTNIPQYKSFGSYKGVYNFERAANIAKARRQSSMTEIRTALKASSRPSLLK
ncbi:hypothetical protein FF80_03260 [Devosia sp. LC5]|nr:hypothetical protein FF80_03260 [Devosia sp. LC5]